MRPFLILAHYRLGSGEVVGVAGDLLGEVNLQSDLRNQACPACSMNRAIRR